MLSGDRMPPLALYGGDDGRLSPSSSSFSVNDPFESSTLSSASSDFSSNSGAGSGNECGAGYITGIDFFVPVDLACGPPDDLSHASTPRRPSKGLYPSSFPAAAGGGEEGAGDATQNTKNRQQQQNGHYGVDDRRNYSKSNRKKPRSLKSLLFGDRPSAALDLATLTYKPRIEYVAGGGTKREESSKSAPLADGVEASRVVPGGVEEAGNEEVMSNKAFMAPPSPQPQFSSSGYLVFPPSSSWGGSSSISDGDGSQNSNGGTNYLTLSASKPRAVVDGIECQRYNLVDREQRQEVATNLREICLRLGPRRARRMVLPALDLLCDFEDTPPLIAQSLPAVFAACEGATHAHLFVSLVYDLCSASDPIVSIEASNAVKTILTNVEATQTQQTREVLEHFYPLLVDMTFSPYTSLRCTAASTMALLARLATSGDDRHECLLNFSYLCEDRDVSVRRSALATLHEWLFVVPAAEWARFPLGLVSSFLTEVDHDTVRIQLVEVIVRLASKVGKSLAAQHLLGPTIELAKDRSWRVRYVLASHLGFLYDLLSYDVADLMPTVLLLSNDEEVEVRVSTAGQIGMIASLAPSATVETTLVDVVNRLGHDSSPEVRAGIAKSIGPVVAACATSVGRPLILNVMVPLLSDTAVPLVQHTAIMSIAAMAPLMAERNANDLYSLVVVQLQTASRSTTWRVRESVANLLHHFSGHVRTPEQFDELMPIMLRLINDDSAAVRVAVVCGIAHTVSRLGPAWGVKTLTKLIDMLTDPLKSKFYQRIQVCTILSTCLPLLAKDLVPSLWIPDGKTTAVGKRSGSASEIKATAGKKADNGDEALYSSPVSRAIAVSPLGTGSDDGATHPQIISTPSVSINTVRPPATHASNAASGNSTRESNNAEVGGSRYFSRLPTDVRLAFNTKVSEVISRFVSDKVLSVREACARLLVTLSDEAPLLFTAECEAWAAAIARPQTAGYESAVDIVLKSGIPIAPSPTVRPSTAESSPVGSQHDTNPF